MRGRTTPGSLAFALPFIVVAGAVRFGFAAAGLR
jgi:hypothetical protein